MSNIIGYVKNYRQTFDQKGFNQADALVLSWLSYFNYIDDLKGKASLSINQIKEKYLLSSKEMYKDAFLPRSSDKLFTLMKSSPRFSNLILSDFRLIKDYRECEQYASITIQSALICSLYLLEEPIRLF